MKRIVLNSYKIDDYEVSLLESLNSSVPKPGRHLILIVSAVNSEKPLLSEQLSFSERGKIYALAEEIATKMSKKDDEGKFLYRILCNGSAMANVNHFHIHIVLPWKKEHLVSCTYNWVDNGC